MGELLNTFVLVHNDHIISPVLTTTREYGNWLEKVFDSSICNMELYMKSVKAEGERVLEKHPGTRIGNYFDKVKLSDPKYKSWFILEQSKCLDRLVKLKLMERKDIIPISVNEEQGRRMLRCYTVDQIALYIRTKIDRNFSISEYVAQPKQVKVEDMQYIIKQELQSKRKKLF